MRLASVTKLLTGYAALIAIEEGVFALSDAAGPTGSTIAHLLSHASGYTFNGTRRLAVPGKRRIYSNTGIEVLAAALAKASGIPFPDYLTEAVLVPLGMSATKLTGSPAHGAVSTVTDLSRFTAELMAPRLVAPSTFQRATSVVFPGLSGVLPGFGVPDPNDWGLGFEIRGNKRPHWTGATNSPVTFGHFGQSGSWLWVDPTAGVASVGLSDRNFGEWASRAWPRLFDAILAECRSEHAARVTPGGSWT
jgi:CubicO group peptidase (beta-lactamase class C family)